MEHVLAWLMKWAKSLLMCVMWLIRCVPPCLPCPPGSLACGLVMAPVDKMVEAKLARQNRPVLSLNTEGGGGKTELTDPLLDDEEVGGTLSRTVGLGYGGA